MIRGTLTCKANESRLLQLHWSKLTEKWKTDTNSRETGNEKWHGVGGLRRLTTVANFMCQQKNIIFFHRDVFFWQQLRGTMAHTEYQKDRGSADLLLLPFCFCSFVFLGKNWSILLRRVAIDWKNGSLPFTWKIERSYLISWLVKYDWEHQHDSNFPSGPTLKIFTNFNREKIWG